MPHICVTLTCTRAPINEALKSHEQDLFQLFCAFDDLKVTGSLFDTARVTEWSDGLKLKDDSW